MWRRMGSGRTYLASFAAEANSALFLIKDSHDQNRILMGLDLTNPDQEPFLVWYDKTGKKHNAFGDLSRQ